MRKNIHNVNTHKVLILYELHQCEVSGHEVLRENNRLICTEMALSFMNCIDVSFQVMSCCGRVVVKNSPIWFLVPHDLHQCELSSYPLRKQIHHRDYTKWFQSFMKYINMYFFFFKLSAIMVEYSYSLHRSSFQHFFISRTSLFK